MDFKGHFAPGDASRRHPLTVPNDHSRYLVGPRACTGERTEIVQAHLESLFRRYGLPERILWRLPWPAPSSPDPGQGRAPSTAPSKADLLTRRDFASVLHAQPHFDAHRHLYNHQRPHQAPGDAVPASRYRPAPLAGSGPGL